jgi:hypothetical protein
MDSDGVATFVWFLAGGEMGTYIRAHDRAAMVLRPA